MPSNRKSLMRCFGEFVGHVVRGVKTKPTGTTTAKTAKTSRHEVRREEHVEHRGGMTLRRTVIEEIECRDEDRP